MVALNKDIKDLTLGTLYLLIQGNSVNYEIHTFSFLCHCIYCTIIMPV